MAASSSRWALILIFAVTPFQNDVSGGTGPLKFSLAEVNLLLCIPVLLFKARRLRFGPTLLPACLYLAVCLFSALGQWRPSTAQSLVQAGMFTVALVVVFASLGREAEDYRLAINGLIVVALGLACAVFLPESSREYATGFGQERANIQLRYDAIAYAEKLFAANPIQGAGMGLRKDYDATNIVLLCLAETGVPGLLTFLGLNATVLLMVWRPYRRTPPQTLAASLLIIAPALIVGKFMHGLVDHYWSRGSLTTAWATVGMATMVMAEERRRRRQLTREFAAEGFTTDSPEWPPSETSVYVKSAS